MAKPYRIPDFRKMYPEASEEVIAVLRSTARKMQYQEYDLKVERVIIDQEEQTVTRIPSREDSYERLTEQCEQFRETSASTEDIVIRKLQREQLHEAIRLLSEAERELVELLYFSERTEREAAATLGVSQNTINYRRHRLLEKLRHFFKNI